MTPEEFSDYWRHYYERVSAGGDAKLDGLSNRTQVEEMLAVLRVGGELLGARVLDACCGRGQLGEAAKAFGARVAGMDAVVAPDAPGWVVQRDLNDPNGWPWQPGKYDVVFAVECLQYAFSVSATMAALWRLVRPGGRLVGTVSNRDNELVRRYESAHKVYRSAGGMNAMGLEAALVQLGGVSTWQIEPLALADDQTFACYGRADPGRAPFRLVFCAIKA